MIILPTLIPTQIRSLGGNEQYRFSQRWRCESTCESTAHKKSARPEPGTTFHKSITLIAYGALLVPEP